MSTIDAVPPDRPAAVAEATFEDELATSRASERLVLRREIVALAVVVAIVILRVAFGA